MSVAVLGAAGKSGSLSVAAARRAGARTVGIVPTEAERDRLVASGLCDIVAVVDARDPVAVAEAVTGGLGGGADVVVVCVDVPGCEHGANPRHPRRRHVIFFSMATSFPAAALGQGWPAADVTIADRQRVRAWPRRVRPRAAAGRAGRTSPVRAPPRIGHLGPAERSERKEAKGRIGS